MKRSLLAALGVVLVALAVPTMALATHHRSFRHHGHHGRVAHGGWNGPAGAAATVTTYNQGVLTLALSSGGTLAGTVTDRTRFVCVGGQSSWRSNGSKHSRRYTVRHAPDGGSGPSGTSGPSGPSGASGPSGPSGGTGSPPSGSTGTGGYGGSGGYGGHNHGRGRGFPNDSGGNGHGHDFTPPPPCDSSLLTPNAALQGADVVLVPGGVQFSIIIVLLPAVQTTTTD